MAILQTLNNAGAIAPAYVRNLRARTVAVMLTAMSCGALLATSTGAYAQHPMTSGPHTPENGAAAAQSAPDSTGSAAHGSHASQAKDAKDAKGAKKGATAGSKSKPEGAGGLDNGLYETDSGGNK
jgi:hypothetical protein